MLFLCALCEMLRQCMHVQLPRKEAEKAGMTDIPIIARRVCRTKVNFLLNISCSLSGHLLTFVPAKRIPHWAADCSGSRHSKPTSNSE